MKLNDAGLRLTSPTENVDCKRITQMSEWLQCEEPRVISYLWLSGCVRQCVQAGYRHCDSFEFLIVIIVFIITGGC